MKCKFKWDRGLGIITSFGQTWLRFSQTLNVFRMDELVQIKLSKLSLKTTRKKRSFCFCISLQLFEIPSNMYNFICSTFLNLLPNLSEILNFSEPSLQNLSDISSVVTVGMRYAYKKQWALSLFLNILKGSSWNLKLR